MYDFDVFIQQCLVDENEKIRRDVCGCSDPDPESPRVSKARRFFQYTQ